MLNTNDKIIKHKVGLLNLAEELGNISQACKIMGLSRDTFYRYKEAADKGGIEVDQSRRVPNFKNRVDKRIEDAVIAYATDYPAHGQHRASDASYTIVLKCENRVIIENEPVIWLIINRLDITIYL
jgi:hypothetical protein